ncbi:MAG: hypothetical protein JWO94_1797 [Verrucomicrobiaceae bacterium]|nr:hypothetical protein [Verrucomicrobiaceae bacterium]
MRLGTFRFGLGEMTAWTLINQLELVLGLEPKTSSLPRTCSTTELHER